MTDHSSIDTPVIIIGDVVFDGNTFARPWTFPSAFPTGNADNTLLESNDDGLVIGDFVTATGSESVDYDPSTILSTDTWALHSILWVAAPWASAHPSYPSTL